MIPTTIELQRHFHDERVTALRSSMHRPSTFAPRRQVGSWLVSAGLRLAPEEARRTGAAEQRPCPEPAA